MSRSTLSWLCVRKGYIHRLLFDFLIFGSIRYPPRVLQKIHFMMFHFVMKDKDRSMNLWGKGDWQMWETQAVMDNDLSRTTKTCLLHSNRSHVWKDIQHIFFYFTQTCPKDMLSIWDYIEVFGSNCELKATWLALESKLKFYSNLYFSNAGLKHMILSLLAYVSWKHFCGKDTHRPATEKTNCYTQQSLITFEAHSNLEEDQ